jgi:hypothetical protein
MDGTQQAGTDNRQSGPEFWKPHIENWNRSGLTQVEYCRQNHLNRHTFGYWKSKLNKEKVFRQLLPVSIKPDINPAPYSFPSGVSLSFNGRFDVRLDIGFNSDTFLKLMDLLEVR